MEKKKVLHIVEAFGSGIFSFLNDLVNATDDEFDITIAYGIRNETLENFKDYFSDRVKFIEVKNFTRNINLKKDIKAFFEVKKIIKEINPDVIHLHSSKAGFIGRFAANGKKVKIMYNPHGFSFLMKNTSKIKRAIYWGIEKISAIRKCTIIGCSNGEHEEALKLSKNSICINNGVNVEKLEKYIEKFSKREINFEDLKVCTNGRIGYQKNPKMFNEIAEALPNTKFTWIGDGELRDTITSENVFVTGWKKREEALEKVFENDIFILPSLWEGLPISLLEAMYLGKVCIVTDCIGNRDVIKNNENGFMIESVEDVKNILDNLDDETYTRISAKAKMDVIEKFSTNRMVDEYRREYRG